MYREVVVSVSNEEWVCDIGGGVKTGSLGNSISYNILSISRHPLALCLGVNCRRRDAICSPNELASSCSDVSFS